MNMKSIGYYTNKEQTEPVFDPPLTVPCPICGDSLENRPVMTISLLLPGGTRSYFYRAHKQCYTGLAKCYQKSLCESVVDMIASIA